MERHLSPLEGTDDPRTGPAPDAVVIGGGLIGCLVARELALGGRRVLVCERCDEPGLEASTAAAGMLSPQMEDADEILVQGAASAAATAMLNLCLEARAMYRDYLDGLEAATGTQVPYRSHGTVVVALDADDAARMTDTAGRHRGRGLRATFLDAAEVRALEPGISPRIEGGLHLPDDHQVDNAMLSRAAALAASVAGARIATRAVVRGIDTGGGRVTGVYLDDETIAADLVVLAAGAWSGGIEGLPRPIPVRPVKGQIVMFGPDPPPIRLTVGGRGAYCVPRRDGRVLIGASVEEAGFDTRVTEPEIAALRSAAARFVPALRDAPITGRWAGLRPGTPDSLPILGAEPELDGLIYATGHYRNGILLAPLTAALVAAIAGGESPAVDLAAFAPDRPALAGDDRDKTS